MDKRIYLASFTLAEAPYLAGINIRDALLQIIMIMTIYCMVYFYSHTSLDTSIPVLQQLQPWIDTYVQLMLRK